MTETAKTTEQTVREVLGLTYDRFGFQNDEKQVERIVSILDDESKREVERPRTLTEEASAAAEEIRELLWNRYTGGGASASATCDLFWTLGRQDELGWIPGELNGYAARDYESFLNRLERSRQSGE